MSRFIGVLRRFYNFLYHPIHQGGELSDLEEVATDCSGDTNDNTDIEDSMPVTSHEAVIVKQGPVDIKKLISAHLESAIDTAVVVCGPTSLVEDVQECARQHVQSNAIFTLL